MHRQKQGSKLHGARWRLRYSLLGRSIMHPRLGRSLQLSFFILLIVLANFSWYSPGHASAVGANMYLFWDPANGSAPAGWTVITTYDGFFPYGAATTDTFGATTTVPGRPYTPTAATTTIGAATTSASFTAAGGAISALGHVHPTASIVYGADTSS